MSKRSEHVKLWRKNTKTRIIASMGDSCQICGYKKCMAALELHHLDPSTKEMSFGKVMASPKAWQTIVVELRKCILLCSNCHREVHNGQAIIPLSFTVFDESFLNYKPETVTQMTPCPVCGTPKPITYKVCSRSCSARIRQKFDWDTIDLVNLMTVQNLSPSTISDQINMSPTAIRKRAKKLGIITSKC